MTDKAEKEKRSRGRENSVLWPQRTAIEQRFGADWIECGEEDTYPIRQAKKLVLDTAVNWIIAKYGSKDTWRKLEEDVAEPVELDVDADPAEEAVRDKRKKKIRGVRPSLRLWLRMY